MEELVSRAWDAHIDHRDWIFLDSARTDWLGYIKYFADCKLNAVCKRHAKCGLIANYLRDGDVADGVLRSRRWLSLGAITDTDGHKRLREAFAEKRPEVHR